MRSRNRVEDRFGDVPHLRFDCLFGSTAGRPLELANNFLLPF